MIENAIARHKVDYPWKQHQAWASWWANTAHSVGQAPSQMFLHYCIARSPARIHMLQQETAQETLGVKYDGTTTSMLDLYTAQAQRESQGKEPVILPDLETFKQWFDDFETWFNAIKMFKVPKISTNSATKIALFIAAAAMTWKNVEEVTDSQWEDIEVFLTQAPVKAKQVTGVDYQIAKGKWSEHKRQIEATFEVARAIAKK